MILFSCKFIGDTNSKQLCRIEKTFTARRHKRSCGILLGCYFIKYPDTVEAPVVITTLNPPADLYARYDGLIDTLFVADEETVGQTACLTN